MLSSSDGYCSLVIFEKNELGDRLTEEELQEHMPAKMMRNVVRKEEERTMMPCTDAVKPAPISSSTVLPPTIAGIVEASSGAQKEARKREVNQRDTSHPNLANDDGLPQKKKKRVALTYEGPVKG